MVVPACGSLPERTSPTGFQIKDYIKCIIANDGLQTDVNGVNGYVNLCIPSATAKVGDPVTVKVGVSPYPIFKLTKLRLMNVNLRGSSTMRLEQAPQGAGWDVC
jgi:hypothetical protein